MSLSPKESTLTAQCARAMAHQLAGEAALAVQLYEAILKSEPRHAAANYCLGMLHLQSKMQPADSLPHLLTALTAEPQIPDYWLGYLEALLLAERTEQASATLALAREHGLSGRAVEEFAGRLSVKISSSVHATDPAARLELEMLRQFTDGLYGPARICAGALIRGYPERGLGWKIWGTLLAAEGHAEEAVAAMQEATKRLPEDAEAFCNLGVLFIKQKKWEEAAACLRKAIAIDPGFDDAYPHLGFVYASVERFPQAEAMFRRAVARSPAVGDLQRDLRHSSLLFLLTHNPEVPAARLFDEHCAVGKWLEEPAKVSRAKHANDRRPERGLKVGIVSGDLKSHAVANFIEPVLTHLRDRKGLELLAFSNNDVEDEVSRRMRTCFAQWHSIGALRDCELATLIQDDAVDILIDLSGHTSFNRLRAFALKPAPLQVSWLGYPGTTGLQAMDYYLADPHFLPIGQFEHSFTEKLVYLPAAWTFAPHPNSPPVNRLPALQADFVTFGSFNRIGKINPFTVRLWSHLLRATPNSILVMAGVPLDERRQGLTEIFNAEGVAVERLAFFPRCDMQTYLALHNEIDLCLDTFPYTGGTTTNHALWMGVPTLTMVGETPASRQCAANLGHVGLQGFIAADADDFIQLGFEWSRKLPELAQIRSGLRERWLQAPLRRPETLASGLDTALRHMWRRWCRDLPAQGFSITASNQVTS